MNVYLIRDKNLGKDRFNNILTTLNFRTNKKKANPINFIGFCVDSSIDIDTMDTRSDEYISMTKSLQDGQEIKPRNQNAFIDFFKKCETIRKRYKKNNQNDIFILLTNQQNENHFFTWCNYNIRNIFIQTSYWELFFGEDTQSDFPVMYEINAWILRSIAFKDSREMQSSINRRFKGDIMDLCENKEEITLKMRSAFISDSLLIKLADEKIESYLQIKFVIDQLERIRFGILNREMSKLFKTRVHLNFTHDINNNHFVVIEEFGNINLGLDLSERVLYRLLLENEGEIHFDNMKNFKKQIYNLYSIESSTSRLTNTILETINSIFKITYTPEERDEYAILLDEDSKNSEDKKTPKTVKITKESFNQKISKINNTLKIKIPPGVVNDYLIISNENRYKVNLDRDLVRYD